MKMRKGTLARCALLCLLGTGLTISFITVAPRVLKGVGPRSLLMTHVRRSAGDNRSRLLLHEGDPLFPVDCEAVVRGDEEEVNRAELLHITVAYKKRQKPLDERSLLNATRDCAAFKRERRYLTSPLSREEATFPIAYSIVVHHRVDMLERLLRAIYAPQNLYCLHVDAKSPRAYLEAARALAACFPNVFVARRLETVVYASWSRVQADLNCMRELVERADEYPWRYFINLCGLDFPIKTNLEIVRALRGLHGRNCLESRAIAYQTWRWENHFEVVNGNVEITKVLKSPPPIPSPMFAGNTYIVVTRAFVEHVLSDPTARALAEWEKDTYSPDEHMWATLQRMPGVPGSRPIHRKHDVDAVVSIARLVRWGDREGENLAGGVYPHCRGPHVRAVCVNTAGDLAWVLQQRHLFVNKVDSAVDPVAIHCLEEHLRRRALGEASEAL
ncbi:beta-1,3-galactosyl-O-glycosyl-glycoprotein beta-1,6-N-acetylglucosaminyltransferase-like [Lethenteron reissneri]|uniref:beta-1,3-galactosyl-O-glycosyl-glycoprotein beta-1,6-N-acetylglucosaminyltransferase-like n=1 Tax=Lethenteron reissneri TaxID=7753 RepID=UPI002AB7141F|nr:beta-1,3-galactosyl-O-glycosyl-glycoprotein beta-1,6-N-acetylglucosaminyltransferase-like [Lethenteron reissneri]